jgi:hypothetical protein
VPSTEAPISITVKTAAGSLVTVRAESGDELDNIVAHSIAAIASAAQELESAVRGAPAPAATAPSVQSVAAALGGNIIETGTTIPAQEYAQPAPVASIGGRGCAHGKMTAIQGMGKDGKPYKGYFCPAPKGAFDKCKNQYVVVQSPEWNTFVPEQIK